MSEVPATIDAGDVAHCESCHRSSIVRTVDLGREVQVIVCHDGIRAVAVERRPVRQTLIASLAQVRHSIETAPTARAA
jgi:hypothetical protein